MKFRCIERISKLQFGCLTHVADLQGTDEVGEVVGGIIHHGFKHGIHNGFRITEIGGQIFLHILPFPAQVIHSQIQVGVNAEDSFGISLQQLTEQRVQSVV